MTVISLFKKVHFTKCPRAIKAFRLMIMKTLTEESLDIFGTALLRPVSVLQVPDRPLLAREQVFDL